MSKYTAKQIAESDDLFEKQIHKVRKFYLSRNPDKMMMLEERKAVVKERNKGLSPEYDKEYYCGTCGAKDGAEHPKSGYCFYYMDSFSKHEYKEIKADDILSINTEELHLFDKVLVRDNDDEIWKCDLFSHIDKNEKYNKYICIRSCWEQCIPYQGNEHLVNTTDNIL